MTATSMTTTATATAAAGGRADGVVWGRRQAAKTVEMGINRKWKQCGYNSQKEVNAILLSGHYVTRLVTYLLLHRVARVGPYFRYLFFYFHYFTILFVSCDLKKKPVLSGHCHFPLRRFHVGVGIIGIFVREGGQRQRHATALSGLLWVGSSGEKLGHRACPGIFGRLATAAADRCRGRGRHQRLRP